jgi:serine/threonine protein kinase
MTTKYVEFEKNIICCCHSRFQIIEKLGNGSFGNIYKGKHRITEEEVCIKIQENNDINILKNEAIIYNYIQNIDGFPKLKFFHSNDEKIYLIISLLDKNLYEIKNEYKNLSLQSVLKIGLQLIELIKIIHNLGIIHRDIKPQNCMIGKKKEKIHLVDFGFSKKYINSNSKHIEFKNNKEKIGTPDFMSDNILNGIEPSRRDDLISLFYVLIFLYLENNLWKDVNEQSISDTKFFKIQLLYENLLLPKILIDLLKYAYELDFYDEPNYFFCLELINNWIKTYGVETINFEWI